MERRSEGMSNNVVSDFWTFFPSTSPKGNVKLPSSCSHCDTSESVCSIVDGQSKSGSRRAAKSPVPAPSVHLVLAGANPAPIRMQLVMITVCATLSSIAPLSGSIKKATAVLSLLLKFLSV